jgi:hypothetical protein
MISNGRGSELRPPIDLATKLPRYLIRRYCVPVCSTSINSTGPALRAFFLFRDVTAPARTEEDPAEAAKCPLEGDPKRHKTTQQNSGRFCWHQPQLGLSAPPSLWH